MFIKSALISILIKQIVCQNNPIVDTPLGQIEGYHKLSFNKRTFSAFEGIPYAQPPIGQLRLKDPVPIEPWSNTLKADKPTVCLQIGFILTSGISGDEDCLHLNVYVPRESPNIADKLDVIVHIHGGAFIIGSGHFYAHPEFLMDHDVVFVTMNYRLGIFGFLSTNDDVITGNFGLKDQLLSLKWIQENIASFGGNPNSVTITGLSAGGSSVHYLYLTPLSKGLFHRGFSQSGTALNPWALQKEPLKRALYLAQDQNCPIESSAQILDCLQQKPAIQLVNATNLFFGYHYFPISPFGPVIERNSKPYLSRHPYEILASGDFHDLPWINSVVSKEGLTFLYPVRDNLGEINEKFVDLAPYLLDYNYTLPKNKWKITAEKVEQKYMGADHKIDLVDMLSDRLFLVAAEKSTKLQAKMAKSPVYFLYFNYALEKSPIKGVAHAEDAMFFFYNALGNAENMTHNDYKVKDIMVNMLVSYAKDGKPRISGVDWPPTKYEEITYLNLSSYNPSDNKIQTAKDIAPVSFWNSLGILENNNLFALQKGN